MNRKERELISAVSKVARDQITDYSRQHSFAIGTVKGLTLSGAAVQILDSGRFERNVPAVRGAELVLDTQVLLARVGRMGWVILGSVEPGGSTTQTIDTAVPAAGVAGLTATNYPDHVELRWTASYFDIQCYEVMANTSESETGATTYVTDNTQFLYYDDWGTYYFKVRAVGPNWDRGSWSAWTEADIDHRWDLGSDPSWPYRLSFGHYDASWIELFAIGSNGTILFTKIAAPDDSEFEFSQFSFWFDDTPDTTRLHLKGKDSDEVVVNKVIHLEGDPYDEDLRVGKVTEDIGGAGYGRQLLLSGGESVDGTWDSDNSDPIWLARYNVATDETEMRINVGDNGAVADAISFGWTAAGVWTEVYRFPLGSGMEIGGNARVTKHAWLPAGAIRAAGGAAATEGLNTNGWIVISFVDGQDRWAQGNIKVPDDMDVSEDSYICIGWSSPTTSQTLIMDAYYLITAAGDSTEQAGTAAMAIPLTSGTNADELVVSTIATIPGGTITDEMCVHVKMMRDGNNPADTLGDVMELHGVAFQYTANKLGA